MIQRKICMLGAFAVGKTSLVTRFVRRMFSDRYLTTVGVRIDKTEVTVADEAVKLILWDIHGEDEFQKLHVSYLRGTSACILVADGTNKRTLVDARSLYDRIRGPVGDIPLVLALNKRDLADQWEVQQDDLAAWMSLGVPAVETSAKTGEGVEAMFHRVAEATLRR